MENALIFYQINYPHDQLSNDFFKKCMEISLETICMWILVEPEGLQCKGN